MIGLLAGIEQHKAVKEFFELFKTPWEFCRDGKYYPVIISTEKSPPRIPAQITIIYSATRGKAGLDCKMRRCRSGKGEWIQSQGLQAPIFCGLSVFEEQGQPLAKTRATNEIVAFAFAESGQKFVRAGYDIFEEVAHLLANGQPPEYALSPTIEIHIAMLRNWILGAGVPLVEIPPRPHGHDCIVCLTHDVDFLAIRDHHLDHSAAGFLLRLPLPLLCRDTAGKLPWNRLLKNCRAVLLLPLVYLGLVKDIWFDLDRYAEIERGIASTFFFLPRKGHPGKSGNGVAPKYRAAKYEISLYKAHIETLLDGGHEIGLHGIDAWCSAASGAEERGIIAGLTGTSPTGVRMHWLYFADSSPQALEKAGFTYDSTLGYNETVGYRCGTAQVFRLPQSDRLFELPLHVMDTSLFSGKRAHLSEAAAFELCRRLLACNNAHGGVLTINWHTRSLSPERNWDDFYLQFLAYCRAQNAWLAGAQQTVEWFRLRRSIQFDSIETHPEEVHIGLTTNPKITTRNRSALPQLLIRWHKPNAAGAIPVCSNVSHPCVDVPWNGEAHVKITSVQTTTELKSS